MDTISLRPTLAFVHPNSFIKMTLMLGQLTRNDIFTAKDFDNYRFNGTLFQHMLDYCEGNCSVSQLAVYRHARWNESQAENENFNFGPGALLMYGAASFLYDLFPGAGGTPDEATMASLFGA